MLRLLNSLNKLTLEPFTINYNHLQTIRWRRKPRWLPVAKSKVFRVPERTVIPLDEELEIQRLNNNYRTQIKSIRRFLTYKYSINYTVKDDSEHQQRDIEDDFIRCSKINDEWNAACKVLREKETEGRLQNDIQIAKERLEAYLNRKEKESKEIEELVRSEKEASVTFITPENINKAIEHALMNPVDYNYAIDLYGNKYEGRETVPQPVKVESKQ